MSEDDDQKKICCHGHQRTEQCTSGQQCDCLERVPYHLRTDQVIYTKPKTHKPKPAYGSEVRSCLIDDSSEGALAIEECVDYFGKVPDKSPQKSPQLKCRFTGDEWTEPSNAGVRLIPEGAGDWTRYDLISDITDSDDLFKMVGSVTSLRRGPDVVADDEASDSEVVEEKCRCNYPFCKACKEVESSSSSSEAVLIEKSISFDDEILDNLDSDVWLNPVPRRKFLQFANIEQREKYKAELLAKMRDTASHLARSEWMNNIAEFDHYITVLMGESSAESSSEFDDGEVKAEKVKQRRQRKKKRLMYSVDDIKGVSLYNTKYIRLYMEFMEDLKKRSAAPPSYHWPRFMKVFPGYGAAADEEKDPEWLGLLLMAPKECFKEISSSSSCESLPVMSDPGSTTSSAISTECSPSACAQDSTEMLKKAGVCGTEKPIEVAVDEEEETPNSQKVESSVVRKKSTICSLTDVFKSNDGLTAPSCQSRGMFAQSRSFQSRISDAGQLKRGSRRSRFSEVFVQSQDQLLGPANEMLHAYSRKRSTKLLNIRSGKLASLMDEIIVIQQELLPTSLGVKLKEFGEGQLGETTEHPQPEFELRRRNVIFIVRGKLYKMNYECYCSETCHCDPKNLVEKYVGMLISEIYGLEDSEEEEEDAEEAKEADVTMGASGRSDGVAVQSSRKVKESETKESVKFGDQLDSSEDKPSKTRVEEPRFLLDPDVDVDVRDRAIYPKGVYDKEDVDKVKAAAPDGIVAYKDFYQPGDIKGIRRAHKEGEKAKKLEKDKNTLEGSSSVLDLDGDDGATGSSDDLDDRSHSCTDSTRSASSSSSSHPLCQCCDCTKRYEEFGKIVRQCDKKTCSCCACKMKIVRVAKKLYLRKKGARFLYVLLKKIRRAINKPSKETREQALQDIVNVLRVEARRLPRKKWPFYFKEVMISAGLESASETTSLSEQEKDEDTDNEKKKKKPWRYREEPKSSKKYTAADIQQREWESLKAKFHDDGKPVTNYSMPRRAVLKMEDMSRWENSEAYYEYLGFILAMNDVIKGHSCKEKFPLSPNVEAMMTVLNRLSDWIDEIPPIQQPQRFGNKAFRTWLDRLTKEGPTILVELLPAMFHGGLGEAQAYLLEGFGNYTRIDYGTGHEMAFIMFLCCLFKLGVFTKEDQLPVVLTIFTRYLDIARKLQTVYKMEPAGSRGVWALDDFQFIPFLWGSAQLIGHPNIRPTTFLKNEVVLGFYDHYMFLACIKYINENKIGPFAEHSNQLWNISAVPTWDKVNSGLIKMYKGEVLCKFPVIQHVLFGSILPITPAPPSQSERVYTGLVRDGLQPIARPKPCMQPPPPPPPQVPVAAEHTASVPSLLEDDTLAEKFQNVPDPPEQPSAAPSAGSANKDP